MPRTIRAPRGTQLTCKNWLIEAAYRMLQNNLDPEVAFDPDNLVVYGGRGRAAPLTHLLVRRGCFTHGSVSRRCKRLLDRRFDWPRVTPSPPRCRTARNGSVPGGCRCRCSGATHRSHVRS